MSIQSPAKINLFLDKLIEDRGMNSDADLCRALGIFPPVLSKTRSGVLKIGANMILRMHERLDIPVKKIRASIEK